MRVILILSEVILKATITVGFFIFPFAAPYYIAEIMKQF